MSATETAKVVLALLAPASPFLIEWGKSIAKEAGKDSFLLAKKIYERLMKSDDEPKALLDRIKVLASNPQGETESLLVLERVSHILQTDEAALSEIESLLVLEKSVVQRVIAEKHGTVEQVEQSAKSGTLQEVVADTGGRISGVTQRSK